jgi:hypothetical protein
MAATMKQGKETMKYAKVLLKRGMSYSDISEETGIPIARLRVMKFRILAAEKEVLKEETAIAEHITETLPDTATVTETPKPVSKRHYKAIELEAVFYSTSAAACYGFITALPGVIGVAVAIVYGLLCFNSLQMAKNEDIPATAEHGKNRVWALELVAVFAHYYTVNRALWANINDLPFEVKELPENGVWQWQGGEIVFGLAIGIAVLLSAAAIEAVNTRLKLTKEQQHRTT